MVTQAQVKASMPVSCTRAHHIYANTHRRRRRDSTVELSRVE